MSKHNYTNPAFCQNSEFYPVPSAVHSIDDSSAVEAIYNRSLNLEFSSTSAAANASRHNPRDGPLRIQRSMSTRSFVSATTKRKLAAAAPVHMSRQQFQQQHRKQQQQHTLQQQQQQPLSTAIGSDGFALRGGSGRYALVPIEELPSVAGGSNRYAIVPAAGTTAPLCATKRLAKSQDNLDGYGARARLRSDEESHLSFHESASEQYTSLPPAFDEAAAIQQQQQTTPKIKHAFSSDFGSKTLLLVDKNSNQRYQMVPTAEDEELVDDNHEIIQMQNGRAHRYAIIPTDDFDEDEAQLEEEEQEEETCLSNSDLNQSQNYLSPRMPLRTSTPQKSTSASSSMVYPARTPLKNPAATKMLHELLSTPRKTPVQPRSVHTTPRSTVNRAQLQLQLQQQRELQLQLHASQQQIYYATPHERQQEHSLQRLQYETVKQVAQPMQTDRTMAVITPRVAGGSRVHPPLEESGSIHEKHHDNNNISYPQKVASAAITLAVISLMLVLGSTMNSGLIIYMIAHFGKSFYLQFSLVSSFCGVGLGFLGFRSRQCEWLPNRSYTSGYILVTVFCLLKCCGLLIILVLDPYPGLPLHDVTTGVILGLSTFSMFFIGLGVIGSLWCYRPPPDNRVNVV